MAIDNDTLNLLLSNVIKNRKYDKTISIIGKSEKALLFYNAIMVSTTKMKESGLLDNFTKNNCIKTNDSRLFYSWTIEELDAIGAIMFRSSLLESF